MYLSWSPRLVGPVIIPLLILWPKATPAQTTGLLVATLSETPGTRPPKMLPASYSTCLFSGLCAALVAVALAYYVYW